MKTDGTLYTVIFTFITAFVFVLPLTVSNVYTKPIVELNQEIAEKGSVLDALGIEVSDKNKIPETYDQKVSELRKDDYILYKTTQQGKDIYGQKFSGPGLWGTITGVIAVDAQVDRLQGLEIISHNETPGLGGRITEDWFLDQFKGQKIPQMGTLEINQGSGKGDTNMEDSRVDAITGASRTSDYVETLINRELQKIKNRLEALR